MRIYTRGGDCGRTSLGNNERVLKNDLRVEVCGVLDELNSCIGEVVSLIEEQQSPKEWLGSLWQIQNDLFDIGAQFADPRRDFIPKGGVERLEAWIDAVMQELSPLKSFILPGGSRLASCLHRTRSVARRAERVLVSCFYEGESDFFKDGQGCNADILPYVNRLSDLFFVLARASNIRDGFADKEYIHYAR